VVQFLAITFNERYIYIYTNVFDGIPLHHLYFYHGYPYHFRLTLPILLGLNRRHFRAMTCKEKEILYLFNSENAVYPDMTIHVYPNQDIGRAIPDAQLKCKYTSRSAWLARNIYKCTL